MNSHSDYNPLKDAYMGDPRKPGDAYKNYTVFCQVREDYWTHRYVEETGTWDPGEIGHLMDYYDFHQDVTITVWNPSRVSWPNVVLDAAGMPLGIYGGNVTKFGNFGGYVLQGTGYVDSTVSLIDASKKKDSLGGWLAFISAFPVVGPFASGVSLVRDLAQGSQPVTWYPSIPR